jgi:hypothetical protein
VTKEQAVQLITAMHLRREHGFNDWTPAMFRKHFPLFCREEGGFAYAALHVGVHLLDPDVMMLVLFGEDARQYDQQPDPSTGLEAWYRSEDTDAKAGDIWPERGPGPSTV